MRCMAKRSRICTVLQTLVSVSQCLQHLQLQGHLQNRCLGRWRSGKPALMGSPSTPSLPRLGRGRMLLAMPALQLTAAARTSHCLLRKRKPWTLRRHLPCMELLGAHHAVEECPPGSSAILLALQSEHCNCDCITSFTGACEGGTSCSRGVSSCCCSSLCKAQGQPQLACVFCSEDAASASAPARPAG